MSRQAPSAWWVLFSSQLWREHLFKPNPGLKRKTILWGNLNKTRWIWPSLILWWFSRCSCLTWLILNALHEHRGGAGPDRRTTQRRHGAWVLKGEKQLLESVASRGRFVVFVALKGERRNADVKVGPVRSFNAKGPPKERKPKWGIDW